MERLQRIGILVILATGLLMTLAGCGGKPVNKTLQAEEALAAAGFQLKMADTPANKLWIKKTSTGNLKNCEFGLRPLG